MSYSKNTDRQCTFASQAVMSTDTYTQLTAIMILIRRKLLLAHYYKCI